MLQSQVSTYFKTIKIYILISYHFVQRLYILKAILLFCLCHKLALCLHFAYIRPCVLEVAYIRPCVLEVAYIRPCVLEVAYIRPCVLEGNVEQLSEPYYRHMYNRLTVHPILKLVTGMLFLVRFSLH